jgi:hypothetical protein
MLRRDRRRTTKKKQVKELPTFNIEPIRLRSGQASNIECGIGFRLRQRLRRDRSPMEFNDPANVLARLTSGLRRDGFWRYVANLRLVFGNFRIMSGS